jgi:hypothetical protein
MLAGDLSPRIASARSSAFLASVDASHGVFAHLIAVSVPARVGLVEYPVLIAVIPLLEAGVGRVDVLLLDTSHHRPPYIWASGLAI